jgi:hypothetical protein
MTFKYRLQMGVKHVNFSQFSCEKQISFTPIQTTLDGMTTLHLTPVFVPNIFFTKSTLQTTYHATTLLSPALE